MRKRQLNKLAPEMLNAVARHLCAVFGDHEDIRKFDAQAGRVYLQCMRCLRTTRLFLGISLSRRPFPEFSGRAHCRPCAFVGLEATA